MKYGSKAERRLYRLAGPELLPLVSANIIRLEAAPALAHGTFAWTAWDKANKMFVLSIAAPAMEQLSDEEVALAIRHELGHIIGGHFRYDPCGSDMRIAADISVNFWLMKDNDKLVEMSRHALGEEATPVLADEWLKELKLEVKPWPVSVLHDLLHQEAEKNGRSMPGTGGCGGIEAVSEEDAGLAEALASAIAQATGQGPGLGSMGAQIAIQAQTAPPWVSAVIAFMAAFKDMRPRRKRTMSRPNQALMQADRYVPSTKWRWKYDVNRICLLVDTSGSMVSDLNQLSAAIASLAKEGIRTRLIAGDTQVLLDEDVTAISNIPGGGGTDIVPLFERAAEYGPKAIVCFTDGYVPRWPNKVPVPVLWVMPKGQTPPFGERAEYES